MADEAKILAVLADFDRLHFTGDRVQVRGAGERIWTSARSSLTAQTSHAYRAWID